MMNRNIFASKSKAFEIHFAISFSIFLTLLYFIIFHWYPPPFFTTDGGWQGIRLIALVDLVLGPTLTFIVFNPKKSFKLLQMDLSIIALCQIAALAWGIWAVHNERPYLVVFADGIFYPLAYYQIEDTGLKNEELNQLTSGKSPIKVYVDIPTDKNEYFALLTEAVQTKPIHYMGERYKPFGKDEIENISRFSIDMDAYLKGEPTAWHEEYQQFANAHSDVLDSMLFFPLNARYDKYIVAFDKRSMNFVEVLKIPPPDIDEVIRGKKEAKRRRQQAKEKKLNELKQNASST